jgi:hypothetical protein
MQALILTLALLLAGGGAANWLHGEAQVSLTDGANPLPPKN